MLNVNNAQKKYIIKSFYNLFDNNNAFYLNQFFNIQFIKSTEGGDGRSGRRHPPITLKLKKKIIALQKIFSFTSMPYDEIRCPYFLLAYRSIKQLTT